MHAPSAYSHDRLTGSPLSRRQFLWQSGGGLGGIALAGLLAQEGALGAPPQASPGVLKVLHHPPKATRVVQLFMGGAASHLDLWDYKDRKSGV